MDFRVILDNSIMQKGKPATAGSKMLESFISPIDATVVTHLEDAGVSIIGRAEMGEFGASGLFKTGDGSLSYSDDSLLSESVNAVAEGKADIALCNDYTSAVSYAAALRGVCYIHPTYGTVSRYGLMPFASSIDQIGIVCRRPADGFHALRLIAGHDSKDGAMFTDEARLLSNPRPLDTLDTPQTRITNAKPKYSEVYTQLIQILCCAELSNNISRYDGIKYGYRAEGYRSLRELYTKSRTEAFGSDVKLAAIIGAMVLSQENYTRYYEKAMRLRRMIRDSLEFDKYDLICETDDKTENRPLSYCVLLSRLCGLPSIVTPDCTYVANVGGEGILEEMCEGFVSGGKAL